MKTVGLSALGLAFLASLPAARAQDELDQLIEPAPSTTQSEAAPEKSEGEAPAESPPADSAATEAADAETTPAAPASAAEPETAAAPRKASSRLIEEIVVTAQKREENLQDVPIAVAAFSADMLDARGIDDPKALAINTPGMVYNQLAGYSIVYMRGIGSDAFIPSADASIATYIDGIYYPFNHGLAQSFGALERIEILKGPQGTLFGRNSTGGAINVVTKKPALSEVEGELQLSVAQYDNVDPQNDPLYTQAQQLQTRAHVSLPLHDNFAVALSGIYNVEDPYYNLISPNRGRAGPDLTEGFRTKLRWTPLENLDVIYSYTSIQPQGPSSNRLVGHDVKPLATSIDETAMEQPDYVDGADYYVYFRGETRVHALDATLNTPWFDMRALVADQDILTDSSADYDGTNGNIASFRSPNQFADVQTAELQFISSADSWGSDWLKWIGGIYYIESVAGYDELHFTLEANSLARMPADQQAALREELAPLGVTQIPGLDQGGGVYLVGTLGTESTSYFAQATADITDWFALTLGGRFQSEDRGILKSSTSQRNPDDSEGQRLFNFAKPSESTSNFSPRLVLDFKPWDSQLFYLSYTKGFKSGTFNIINIYQQNSPFIPPETVATYELGYKGDLLDGYLRLNAAVFSNDIANVQVQTISLQSGGAVRFETAGGAQIKGAELDLTWEFLPNLVPGLVASLSGMVLDGKYTDYSNGSGFADDTGQFQEGLDFTGNKTLRTPELSSTAALNYNFDLGPGNLELGGDIYYNSGYFFTAQNKDSVAEQPYELINARMSYLYTPWDLRITAFGKNIKGAEYRVQMFENDFSTWKSLAPPASYGVRLNWNF